MKQTGIEGIFLTEVFHDWMNGSEAERKARGEASHAEKEAIKSGEAPLPPGARLMLDLNTVPKEMDKDLVIQWPEWVVKLLRDGQELVKDVFKGSAPEAGLETRIQAPERPGGVYQRSLGYRIILVGPTPEVRCSMRIEARVGEWEAEPLEIPWCARG